MWYLVPGCVSCDPALSLGDRQAHGNAEEHRMALAPTSQPYLFTVEEYLAFERTSDECHEYLDGVIYAMPGSASPQAMAGEGGPLNWPPLHPRSGGEQ